MATRTPDDAQVDQAKMPLLEHLAELRRRLLYSMVAFLVCFFFCFYFANDLFNFLVAPLEKVLRARGEAGQPGEYKLIYTALTEKFFVNVKVAFFAAAMVAFPVIASQIWMFVAPGLYRSERKAFLPFLYATPVLFLLGSALVYYFLMPVAWKFFVDFQDAGTDGGAPIELLPRVSEYLSLSMRLIFAFGLAFELPVALTLMVRAGLTSSDGLAAKRRYAIVIAFIAAAVLTPPDPLSQISLAIPIIVLYEISIWTGRFIERQRARETAALTGAAE